MSARAIIATVILGIAAAAGIASSRAVDIRMEERLAFTSGGPPAAAYVELPMRLVDAGGVGIVVDTAAWGGNYSHGTGAFHTLIRAGTAEIDTASFSGIARDWRGYVDRMVAYGNTGVVVPAFLELIDFDLVGDGERVYPAGSVFRQRQAALRGAFGELFDYAAERGLDVYLKTDMLALTPPLERMLRDGPGRLDTEDPALWHVYAAGMDELFSRFPDVRGVVIRVGEAGALYNLDGWAYRSEMAVRTPAQLRLMLKSLLPVFERHGRDLVLRSWTVGVGPLGHLHTDAAVYESVLGDIASPRLIVSTKFTQGDFFSYLPLNPTLASGPHRRLIEFQARREFEAFGAIPNFLAADHARAIRALVRQNPNIIGTSLWTQEGGPLRAGPMSLYPVHGFWPWIDANVYATSRLARDPSAEPAELAAAWVRESVSTDPVVVSGLARVLLRSRDAVQRGLYVRPFAQMRASVGGVEATPMMWIMEWDVVGDWTAIGSTVYRASEENLDEAIADGFAAVADVIAMQRVLDSLEPKLGDDPLYNAMRRSLEYELSLLEALARYRNVLLSYYDWLATGKPAARRAWRESAPDFRTAAARHARDFGRDLDFPAYDLAPALAGLDRAERSTRAADLARVTLALFALLMIGLPIARARRNGHGAPARPPAGAIAPLRLALAALPAHRARWLHGTIAVLLSGVTVALLFAFDAPRLAVGCVLVMVTFVAALHLAWRGTSRARVDSHALSVLHPLLIGAAVTLAVIAVRGSDYFWFRFWSDAAFRAVTFAAASAVALWMPVMAFAVGRRAGFSVAGAFGSMLVATGVALIALSALLPDLPALLAAFDRPLSMLPIRFALLAALTEYANLPANAPWYPAMVGSIMLAGGTALCFLGVSQPNPATIARTADGLAEETAPTAS